MKSSYLPHLTLAALLVAALLTLFAGTRMARQEEVVRTQVGREEISDLSAEMMEQLSRLDRLYEGHLQNLAKLDREDRFALRKECDRIVGIRQFALAVDVDWGGKTKPFQETFDAGWRGVPMLPGMEKPTLGGDLYDLPIAMMRSSKKGQGWVNVPGQPLMYWKLTGFGEYVVITPNLDEIEAAIHGWLNEWVAEVIEPVEVTGANVRISGAGGEILSVDSELTPDVVVPLRAQFGSWKIAAWDERKTVVSHDTATLAVSVGVAGIFALLGFGAFVVLRRALRMSEQRVSFVNRVSHELRTPLTNILLNNDLASDALEIGDDKAATGRLDLVREEAGRLSRLIANVLTFSRVSDGEEKVRNEVFPLADCVERTLAPFRPSLERKGIKLSVKIDHGLRVLADPDMAAQVLANLVSNVEKYAGDGGRLEIVGGSDDGSAPMTSLRVSDSGPGIPRSARDRIFEPFVRLSERVDEGVSGTGLGLSIARDLAAKMGGELVLEDSDKGAVFLLRLQGAPENLVVMEDRKIS